MVLKSGVPTKSLCRYSEAITNKLITSFLTFGHLQSRNCTFFPQVGSHPDSRILTTCGRKASVGLSPYCNVGWRQNLKRIWCANHCITNHSKFIGLRQKRLLFLISLNGSQLSFTCLQFAGGLTGAGWSRMVLAGMFNSSPMVCCPVGGLPKLLPVMMVEVQEKSKNCISAFEASMSSLITFYQPWPTNYMAKPRCKEYEKRLWPFSEKNFTVTGKGQTKQTALTTNTKDITAPFLFQVSCLEDKPHWLRPYSQSWCFAAH